MNLSNKVVKIEPRPHIWMTPSNRAYEGRYYVTDSTGGRVIGHIVPVSGCEQDVADFLGAVKL